MRTNGLGLVVVATLLILGCGTTRNPTFCEADAECDDPTRSFCDVDGDYAKPNTCIAPPSDCPVERCGCEPGAALSCSGDMLVTCGADGKSSGTTACGLGCSADEPRCLTFEPSNGVGGALAMIDAEPDVVLTAGATINASTGAITNGNGAPINVRSFVVAQNPVPIRVLVSKTFTAGDLRVITNPAAPHALAIVADTITLKGVFDAAGKASVGGPGAQLAGTCVGSNGQETTCGGNTCARGGGGAGHDMGGANGGFNTGPGSGALGGSQVVTTTGLLGGCNGGGVLNLTGAFLVANGGGGGGAIQLVGQSRISFDGGLVQLGGGGGTSAGGGGGSGGLLLVESPRVTFAGPTSGVVANGGSGGSCDRQGVDGLASTAKAFGPICSMGADGSGGGGGDGGTSERAPTAAGCGGTVGGIPVFCTLPGPTFYGGGGGAAGRARLVTRDATLDESGGPMFSAAVSKSVLVAK